MSKLVVLNFDGSIDSGFTVTLAIGQEGKSVDLGRMGTLPPATELSRCLADWQQQYNQLGINHRIKPQQIIYNGVEFSHFKLNESATTLGQMLAQWLNSPSFRPIDKHLREELNREEVIRMLICSDRPEIYQLPWCCWDLVTNYPRLEIAYSSPNFTNVPVAHQGQRHQRVRILAILGDAQGIDLEGDRSFLSDIEQAAVEFLIEPTLQELNQNLWQKTWDIVFFAGHSNTQSRQGVLYLNSQEQITIEQLSYGFKQAIARGLQLAIFNSCDGLGLAEELGQLFLPQSIVMRMPIPDQMAHQFVRYFLQAYANGNSMYLAMRQAREQLQGWEQQFPCASWLPIIYQNPAVIPPSWSDLQAKAPNWSRQPNTRQPSFTATLLMIVIAIGLVWILQAVGWLEKWELNVYDRFMAWRFFAPKTERVLVVTIDDQDLAYQKQAGLTMRGSLADSALEQLIHKLQAGQAKVIASDIIHDFPYEPKLAETISQMNNFVAICRIGVKQSKLSSIASPPQLETAQLGFSNWAIDRDRSIRRQVLGMSPDDVCQSDISLSLRLAMQYLVDISAEFNPKGELKLGNTIFPKLQPNSGGYRLPVKDAQGYQILLNYRQALPSTIPLREVLSMPQQELNPLIKDKIVLIGVHGHNHDLHLTPYRKQGQKLQFPGVVIHALMTSQIIDTVLGEGKLLAWVSEPIKFLWLVVWSLWGSILMLISKNSFWQISWQIFGSLTLLLACCGLFFLNGIWLVAIAPALGLLLSALLVAVYIRG